MMKTYKDLKEYKALKNYTMAILILFFLFFLIGIIADFNNLIINFTIIVVSIISIFYFSKVLQEL